MIKRLIFVSFIMAMAGKEIANNSDKKATFRLITLYKLMVVLKRAPNLNSVSPVLPTKYQQYKLVFGTS